MLERIEEIRSEAAAAIGAAGSSAELEELRVHYLGRKAELTTILRGIAELPAEERGKVGGAANRARKELEALLEESAARLDAAELDAKLVADRVDVTLPGAPPRPVGHAHLIARTTRQIEDIMVGLGYRVAEGPEIEHDYYNFTALNHPPGHPARMLQDTFYVQSHPDVLLRTHTSPMQVRAMEAQPPPIFIVVPGKVYRRDSDATHSPMFHQMEGLAIAEGLTLADLQGDAAGDVPRPLRPEPRGAPAAALLPLHRAQRRGRRLLLPVRGDGDAAGRRSAATSARARAGSRSSAPAWSTPTCSASSRTRLRPERVQGFAFGLGVERVAMLRHGVPDLRRFFDNDVRMLEQFS